MKIKTPAEIAFHLSRLFHMEFADKAKGRYLISHSDLRRLSGRCRLESGVKKQISAQLAELGFVLIYIESQDKYGIEQEQAVLKWRDVPKGVLSKEARRSAFVVTLSPAAAWPFPTGTRA